MFNGGTMAGSEDDFNMRNFSYILKPNFKFVLSRIKGINVDVVMCLLSREMLILLNRILNAPLMLYTT